MKDLDRAKGIIFGLAIGDALGWPTEFMSLSQIKSRYGNSGITDLNLIIETLMQYFATKLPTFFLDTLEVTKITGGLRVSDSPNG